MLLFEFNILQYDRKAQDIYHDFKKQRIRIGTQVRIGSIALANEGILLTINIRDFEIPGLTIQDWI